jgi:uncharacterized protein YcbK (DUF882 family)
MRLTVNFHLSEFACNDKDRTPVPPRFFDNVTALANDLQVIRDTINEPLIINSGYRTVNYNKSIGGANASQHLIANAADIRAKGLTPEQLKTVVENLIQQGKIGIRGIGIYDTFIHVDRRSSQVARWDERTK